uniref:Uncharacterized protein n=1 Tax=Anguilla anguilla TaxID=7936 RepID=A0A0E9W8I6_ANGAN
MHPKDHRIRLFLALICRTNVLNVRVQSGKTHS